MKKVVVSVLALALLSLLMDTSDNYRRKRKSGRSRTSSCWNGWM